MPDLFKLQVTDAGKAERLIQVLTNNRFYFAFGKSTAWDSTWGVGINDANPPTPASNLTSVAEPFIYKAARVVLPAVESGCGVLDFQYCSSVTSAGKKYQVLRPDLDLESLIKINPRYGYFEVSLLQEDFLNNPDFRIMGLFTNPVLLNGDPATGLTYNPNQLLKTGTLSSVIYGTPTFPDPDKQTVLNLLIAL